MDYSRLIKESRAYRLLTGSERAHASLIIGADPLLPELTAAAFAETLCRKSDVAVLPANGGDRVRAEDINWLTSDCWIKPFDSEVKVYLINKADTMTEQAQNKLLKTLEEPPQSAVLVLSACSEAKILRTVASRCRLVRCASPTAREIYDCLTENGADGQRADFAAAFSGGSLYLADKMLQSDVYTRAADTVYRVFSEMKTSRDILCHSVALAAFKDIFDTVLDFMITVLRDISAVHANKRELVFTKRRAADIIELSQYFNAAACAAIIRAAGHAKKSLYYNCNFQGVLDGLLFSFLEIKATNK